MKITLFLYSVLFSSYLYSQNIDFANYKPLESNGPIPNVFTELSFDRYYRKIVDYEKKYEKKDLKNRKDYLLKSNYHIADILHSGKVLFGDPITQYVNDVAKELLKDKPEIYKKLQFYTLKTSTPNASSTAQGIIFVNTGLIAKLKNEAELAFVIAHEIAHYIADDQVNSYLKNVEILNGKKKFESKSMYDQINRLGKYSREVESTADSSGTVLFLESNYSPKNIITTLHSLYYSEMPIGNVRFDKNFFNTNQLIIPECYYADKIPTKSEIKEVDDEEHTHPNILKRIENVKTQIGGNLDTEKKDYLVSEKRFKYIQKIAFFEQVRSNILAGDYGKAIYNSYCLLLEYPNNKYLELSIAKALYGLTRYANAEEYHKVAASYTKIEGESHQVHFFLRQLTKKQLTTVALNYAWDLMEKYGNNNCLDQLETGIIYDLVVYNEFTLESFNKPKSEKNNIMHSDDRNKNSKRELQRKFKDFYKPVFYTSTVNERIAKKFNAANEKLERKKNYEDLSYKEKEKFKTKYHKGILENGLKYYASKVYVLDPFFDNEMRNKNKSLINSEKNKIEYEKVLKETTTKLKLKTELLSYSVLKENDAATYNLISAYKDVFYEVLSNEIEGFYPIGAYSSDELKTSDNEFLCINGIFEDREVPTYYNLFIELKTGKIVFVNDKQIINMNNHIGNAEHLKKDLLLFKTQ